jgi:hypothetical protein
LWKDLYQGCIRVLHGFSAEFAEHKVYNVGESTKHIDWKLFARTDRLYTKRLKKKLICVAISLLITQCIYPKVKKQNFHENKIGFSVLASAVLMNIKETAGCNRLRFFRYLYIMLLKRQ